MSSLSPSQEDSAPLSATAVAGVGRRSAIDAVRARIAMAISLGLLKPGERLPDQQEIALGLSVSPMTARRAMASLAEAGVVVRRRGRDGGTFVSDSPPTDTLVSLRETDDTPAAIHALVDRRLLAECAITHFAAVNATDPDIDELEQLTGDMAEASNWSQYHQADKRFHLLVARASQLGTAVESYGSVLTELYEHFIPYPIEALHRANLDHIALVDALRRRDVRESVDVARGHVDVLHRTMFMELSKEKSS
ncbi:DNA-binding FadR family transcriptional regulator [Arthrobacter pigmenti]|uniref:DNA-binding FadR family transcriptional regulator n=1 Tax=Arthrobacter pigmenti TaxID=271432 RepID=A0A846RIA9_9MICC|nr:FCD domain-containing protein [Arthrobacter pigmenti]NJC21430.1 DNA-binding FadR family transcriptional regulator [Arthrobacter pigmenti]